MNTDDQQNIDINDDGHDLDYLKSDNPWLISFNLTDTELTEVIRLMTRVIIGSDPIIGFRDRLSQSLKRDQLFINDLVVAILTNRFLALKPHIEGFDDFVKDLGLEGIALKKEDQKSFDLPGTVAEEEELKSQINQYDWVAMKPLEKRIALEELGINQKQLNEFLKSKQ